MTPASPNEDHLHVRFWLITLAIFSLVLWLLSGALLPFLLGLVIAYFLDPVVRSMHKAGLPRWLCAFIVLLFFLALISGTALLVAPLIRAQIIDLVTALPAYIKALQEQLWPAIATGLAHIPNVNVDKLQSVLSQYSGDAMNFAGRVLRNLLSGGLALIDLLALFILTPIIAFYLLRDFPKIVENVDNLLPKRHAATIRAELGKMDHMVAGFIRGQATVSLCLAAFYSTALSIVGLKYGMVIGLATGFLSFIPIVGTITGLITSLIMAFIQFDHAGSIAAVAGVFVLAQMLDGYFLTPNLVGDSVGLHPVWIMFAVLTGAKLFGFVGVLLGVPVVGALAILVRFAVRQYRASRYYSVIPLHTNTQPPQG